MILFKALRTSLHNYFLGRQLKKAASGHHTCNYENANSIAVVFDVSRLENLKPVKKFYQKLRSGNKTVHLLGYVERLKEGQSLSFDFMTLKNLNWVFIPEHPKATDIMQGNHDILISLCTEKCIPLEYVSAMSNAAYRVGRFIPDKTFCFDLMIDLQGNKDITYLISQVDHYLQIIRPEKQPAL